MPKLDSLSDEEEPIIRRIIKEKKQQKPDDVAVLRQLVKGELLILVKKGGKEKQRTVFIDDRKASLRKICANKIDATGAKKRQTLIALTRCSDIIDGAHTDAFLRLKGLAGKTNRCFSLVFDKNECKTIDILCSDVASKNRWIHGLTLIIARLMPSMITSYDIAQCYFVLADVNNDGKLSFDEIFGLLKRLHISLDRWYVQDLFTKIDTNSDKVDNHLYRSEFLLFVKTLFHCKQIEALFDEAKSGGEYLDSAKFADFLRSKQKEDISLAEIDQLIERHELSVSMRGFDYLSYPGFRSYLMSQDNSVLKPEASTIYHDMTQPLTNYWIFSSHNTYLIGNQVTGKSSTYGYTAALRRGCRCVEIDCWDGDDGEPRVTHGNTLTTELLFRDVIIAIMGAAFTSSPYPVILSLENHCSKSQQKRMAKHMMLIFGKALCTSLYHSEDHTKMLSPDELKNKILIKGNILKAHHAFLGPANTAAKKSSTDDDDDAFSLEESGDEDEQARSAEKGQELSRKKTVKKRAKVAKELSDITAIPAVKLPKLRKGLSYKLPFGAVSSLVESKLEEFAEKSLDLLVQHTDKYFIRVYPTGLRIDSSNYDPMPGLVGGCQLVALNLQTPDKFYKMYNGFFLDNANCGYILKQNSPRLSTPMILRLHLISGYQLGKTGEAKVLDPYVILRIYGANEDETSVQTKVIKNNGFNPIWDERFTFPLCRPDVACLRFIVMDDDEFVTQYSLPVRLLRPGYRNVPLDNDDSSALLVHSTFATSHKL